MKILKLKGCKISKVHRNTFFTILLILLITSYTRYLYSNDKNAAATQVDNSQKNSRDVQGGPLTPEDQSQNKNDLHLTQQIRASIVKDDTLSTNAKNVKIITRQGVVTLRGPVATQAEKENISNKAKQIAGTSHVVNQLEVQTH